MAAKGDLLLIERWLMDLPPEEEQQIRLVASEIQKLVQCNEQVGVMALALVSKQMEAGNDA